MKYSKPALSVTQQIARLQRIGLHIPDIAAAEQTLRFISYFRLKGYFLPFMTQVNPSASRTFIAGATFDAIVNLYEFDKKLRLLVMEELERIEVGVRTIICNELSCTFGPHWYLANHKAIFSRPEGAQIFLSAITRETTRDPEQFVSHYLSKYDDPIVPSSWVMAECLTFGVWSRLYHEMAPKYAGKIASEFGLPPKILNSWLNAFRLLRNVCAHHGRLWNRRHRVRISGLTRQYPTHFRDTASSYSRMVAILLMSRAIDGKSAFHTRLKMLLVTRPPTDLIKMNFPQNWATDPLWA